MESAPQNKIELAKEFATRKFEEAGTGNHFLDVCHILKDDFGVDDPDVLTAAILHDILEDTDTTSEELEQTFSKEVAEMVEEVSHPKNYNAEQKNEYYEKIKHISWGGKMIKLADFASHLREFIGAFTGENNLKKFTYDEYCVYIRGFLQSCEDSPAKEKVTALNERLNRYIVAGEAVE
jgi:(p)ppGpp synthase/HD superfamily hydrolase